MKFIWSEENDERTMLHFKIIFTHASGTTYEYPLHPFIRIFRLSTRESFFSKSFSRSPWARRISRVRSCREDFPSIAMFRFPSELSTSARRHFTAPWIIDSEPFSRDCENKKKRGDEEIRLGWCLRSSSREISLNFCKCVSLFPFFSSSHGFPVLARETRNSTRDTRVVCEKKRKKRKRRRKREGNKRRKNAGKVIREEG